MSTLTLRHVGIGSSRMSATDEVLEANLGSCLGIAIAWAAERRFALAHCLLPHRPAADTRYARYADSAPHYLLKCLKVPPNRVRELRAIVGGGGKLFGSPGQRTQIGAENIEAGRTALRALGVRVLGMDVGDQIARRIRVNAGTGEISIIRMKTDEPTFLTWRLL